MVAHLLSFMALASGALAHAAAAQYGSGNVVSYWEKPYGDRTETWVAYKTTTICPVTYSKYNQVITATTTSTIIVTSCGGYCHHTEVPTYKPAPPDYHSSQPPTYNTHTNTYSPPAPYKTTTPIPYKSTTHPTPSVYKPSTASPPPYVPPYVPHGNTTLTVTTTATATITYTYTTTTCPVTYSTYTKQNMTYSVPITATRTLTLTSVSLCPTTYVSPPRTYPAPPAPPAQTYGAPPPEHTYGAPPPVPTYGAPPPTHTYGAPPPAQTYGVPPPQTYPAQPPSQSYPAPPVSPNKPNPPYPSAPAFTLTPPGPSSSYFPLSNSGVSNKPVTALIAGVIAVFLLL